MKKIGCFRKDRYEFIGSVTLLQSDIHARIAPVKNKASRRTPDFLITKISSDKFNAELGMAWQKHSLEYNIPYLDVIFDSPSLSHSMSAILCEGGNGLWYLHWDRARAAEEMLQTLHVQEELKPQLGIRPIVNLTSNILRFIQNWRADHERRTSINLVLAAGLVIWRIIPLATGVTP